MFDHQSTGFQDGFGSLVLFLRSVIALTTGSDDFLSCTANLHPDQPDGTTILPTFMPVATQAALKGLNPQQVEALGMSLFSDHNRLSLGYLQGYP
jgi:hypothetical protein